MSNDKPITLEQLFRYKRPWGQFPHQDAAIIEMEEDIQANGYAVAMRRDRPWFLAWTQDGKQPDPIYLAPAQKIIKANGAALAGLTRRRAAEVALFVGAAIPPPPPPRFTPSSPLSTLVTSHITYGELCLGEQRRRFVNQAQCDIATELCAFIEKARAEFGNQPVIITSAHRPKAVNDAVGGAADSEHLYKPGCGAIDWYIKDVSVKLVQDWCDRNWPFSLGYGAERGFVHLGIRAGSPRPRVRWVY